MLSLAGKAAEVSENHGDLFAGGSDRAAVTSRSQILRYKGILQCGLQASERVFLGILKVARIPCTTFVIPRC